MTVPAATFIPLGDALQHRRKAFVRAGRGSSSPRARETRRSSPSPSFAVILVEVGRYDEAIEHAKTALRSDPRLPRAHDVLATYPDPRWRDPAEALRLARHASERTGGRDPEVLAALAAAAAAARQRGEAEETAGRAVKRAAAAGKPELAADIERRAALYRI